MNKFIKQLTFNIYMEKYGGSITVMHDKQEIGIADIHINNRHILIKKLVVYEKYRSLGVGSALMNYIMDWCDKNKIFSANVHACSAVTLDMKKQGIKGKTQEELIAFYKEFDFIEDRKDFLTKKFHRFCIVKPQNVFL